MDQMTGPEVREWKAWLLAEGKEPSLLVTERSKSGSVFDYDDVLGAVIERTPEGTWYRIEVSGGEIKRSPLSPFPSKVSEEKREPIRWELWHFALAVCYAAVFIIVVFPPIRQYRLIGLPAEWSGPSAFEALIIGVLALRLLVDPIVRANPGLLRSIPDVIVRLLWLR